MSESYSYESSWATKVEQNVIRISDTVLLLLNCHLYWWKQPETETR